MPFPNAEGKHAGQPYVTARRLLGYHEAQGNARAGAAPRAVVLTWQAAWKPGYANAAATRSCLGPGRARCCCGWLRTWVWPGSRSGRLRRP